MSSNEIGTSEIGTTAFLGVFEQKLEKMKSRLKTELGKKRNTNVKQVRLLKIKNDWLLTRRVFSDDFVLEVR